MVVLVIVVVWQAWRNPKPSLKRVVSWESEGGKTSQGFTPLGNGGALFLLKALPRWWFQPNWKILVKLDHFPQVGVKINKIWNHHLVTHHDPLVRPLFRPISQAGEALGSHDHGRLRFLFGQALRWNWRVENLWTNKKHMSEEKSLITFHYAGCL